MSLFAYLTPAQQAKQNRLELQALTAAVKQLRRDGQGPEKEAVLRRQAERLARAVEDEDAPDSDPNLIADLRDEFLAVGIDAAALDRALAKSRGEDAPTTVSRFRVVG